MNPKVGVFTLARKQSQRCQNKMLRNFGGTTLTDIILNKLSAFGGDAFFAAYEPEFEEKCKKASVKFLKRSEKSVNIDEPIVEILECLRRIDFDYLLLINGCLPFLKVGTIQKFLDECKASYEPAFAVIKKNNFYLDCGFKPLNFSSDLQTINTKKVSPVYEFAHALYFFNKEYFFENGRYWDWSTVRYLEIAGKKELIDIDTEEDFKFAESVYKISKGI